jgi:hypothetical protein
MFWIGVLDDNSTELYLLLYGMPDSIYYDKIILLKLIYKDRFRPP